MEYKCKSCGCTEFISQLNKYDVFEVIDNTIVLVDSEQIEDKLILYCRDCSEEIEFDDNDVKI